MSQAISISSYYDPSLMPTAGLPSERCQNHIARQWAASLRNYPLSVPQRAIQQHQIHEIDPRAEIAARLAEDEIDAKITRLHRELFEGREGHVQNDRVEAIKRAADSCNPSHNLQRGDIELILDRIDTELARGNTTCKVEAKDPHFPLARSALIIEAQPYILMTKTDEGDIVLGVGAQKKTKKIVRCFDGKEFAVGTIRKATLSPARLETIRTEIWYMRRCTPSDHVINLEAALETEDKFYIISELGEEGSLQQYFRLEPALTEQSRVAIGIAFARSVAEVNGRGILHRDLKPDNAYLKRRENGIFSIKLGDFGAARHQGLETPMNDEYGTSVYAPPEAARLFQTDLHDLDDARRYFSHFQDSWSLGVTLYECLHPEHALPEFAERSMRNNDLAEIINLTDADVERELDILASELRRDDEWTPETEAYLNVIQALMKVDPIARISTQEAYDRLSSLPF